MSREQLFKIGGLVLFTPDMYFLSKIFYFSDIPIFRSFICKVLCYFRYKVDLTLVRVFVQFITVLVVSKLSNNPLVLHLKISLESGP